MWAREIHSALRLEASFQYVPWSRSLHNIIKQFKLALLTQALNAAVSWGENPIRGPPTTLPRFPPQHMWIDNKKKVFLVSPCQGLPGGIGLFHSSLLSLACQPHILPGATEKLWGGCLSDIIHRENGTAVKAEWIDRLRDPFHLIIAPFELFNTNAGLLVVVGGGEVSGISEGWWGKNITVQIKPWVLNFKKLNALFMTNHLWQWLRERQLQVVGNWQMQQTTQLRCKYFY